MAGQVMSPVRFLYAKAFTTQGPCVHQCRGPPSCFLNTFPTHPQVTGATAGYPPSTCPRTSPREHRIRPATCGRHDSTVERPPGPTTASPRGLHFYTQPPDDDRRLQQKIALTTRRTTTSTTTTTLTSNKHNISGYRSVPQFSTKLPQLATTPGGGIEGPEIL